MSSEPSPLFRSEIIRLFRNTFTADRMYSRHRWEKLLQQVQTLLSQKEKTFSPIFITFLGSTQNFAHFQGEDQLHSLNILDVIDTAKCGNFNGPKLLF